MGINAALASWLRGNKYPSSSGTRFAQAPASAVQSLALTALSASSQQTQPEPQQLAARQPATKTHTVRTVTAVNPATPVAVDLAERQAAVRALGAHVPVAQGAIRGVAVAMAG